MYFHLPKCPGSIPEALKSENVKNQFIVLNNRVRNELERWDLKKPVSRNIDIIFNFGNLL
jgi:hypothetical protein